MKIFKKILASCITVGILVGSTLGLCACGEQENEIQTATQYITTTKPTQASTIIVSTKKVIEMTVKSTEVIKEKSEDSSGSNEDEDGSNESVGADDNDNFSFASSDDNDSGYNNVTSDVIYSPYEFMNAGVVYWGGYTWTYYSELILSGEGLYIPGRHTTEDGYVCDGDGYVVLAADLNMLPKYSIVDTPFGYTGKVYDTGCAYGVLDVYVSW